MAKAVIFKTNKCTRIMGNTQCSNGAWFSAEGCYKYCNDNGSDFLDQHQADKLIYNSTLLGHDKVDNEKWYKDRNNFVDIEFDYDVNQEYQSNLNDNKDDNK